MKLSQEKIDKIHKISDWCIKGIILVGLAVIFLKPGNWFWWVFGGLLIVAIAVNIISGHLATDEELAEFKKAVRDAMREEREAEQQKRRKIPSDERIKSPLKGLTPQQEDAIISLLCNKVLVINGRLKTSELKHLLKALKRQGDLDDSNLERVIAWVKQVTGYEVDERNLKYDYEAKLSEKEISKWGNIIRERFDLIEIS